MNTWEEIQNMNDEELKEANAKASRRVINRFVILPLVIAGGVYLINKWVESRYPSDDI